MCAVEKMSLGRCPACGDRRRRPAGAKGALRLHKCLGCGLVYLDPQPRAEVERRYLGSYDLAAHFGRREARKTVLHKRRLARLPSPAAGRDRLCDVGCGDGQFLELARREGWRACGVDINPPAVKRARARGFEVFEGNFEAMDDLAWGSFDLVTSWDSLEHSAEPRLFAQRLARLLAPGGHLALTTLNRRSLAAMVFRTRWSMVVPDHFTYWERRSLEHLFNSLGLSSVRTETFGLGRDFVFWADRLSGPGRMRRSPENSEGGPAELAPTVEWDTRGLVIRVENVLNEALRRFGGGVGVDMLMRKPSRDRQMVDGT